MSAEYLRKSPTHQILDILQLYDVSATFAVLGKSVRRHPGTLRRIVDDGHSVMFHSDTHLSYASMPLEDMRRELEGWKQLTRSVLGDGWLPPGGQWLFRPPYGVYNGDTLKALRETGFVMVLWNADTKDWQAEHGGQVFDTFRSILDLGRGPTLGGIRDIDTDNMVLLMHDIHRKTASALEMMLQYAVSRGHDTFANMTQCLHGLSLQPGDVVSQCASRPSLALTFDDGPKSLREVVFEAPRMSGGATCETGEDCGSWNGVCRRHSMLTTGLCECIVRDTGCSDCAQPANDSCEALDMVLSGGGACNATDVSQCGHGLCALRRTPRVFAVEDEWIATESDDTWMCDCGAGGVMQGCAMCQPLNVSMFAGQCPLEEVGGGMCLSDGDCAQGHCVTHASGGAGRCVCHGAGRCSHCWPLHPHNACPHVHIDAEWRVGGGPCTSDADCGAGKCEQSSLVCRCAAGFGCPHCSTSSVFHACPAITALPTSPATQPSTKSRSSLPTIQPHASPSHTDTHSVSATQPHTPSATNTRTSHQPVVVSSARFDWEWMWILLTMCIAMG